MRYLLRLAIDGCLAVAMAVVAIVLHVSLMNVCRANLKQVSALQR
jgi:hypothetical protein